jgi:hypothetical protein
MKHSFLCLAASLLLLGTAHAQATFHVGPRVGLNVSSAHFPRELAGPEQASYTSRPGVEAGLTGTVQLGHFAVQPSLLFSQKGYRSSGDKLLIDMVTPYEEEVRLNYLTLPLNFAFTLGRNGQGLQVFAGPYASLLVGGNHTDKVMGFQDRTDQVKAASLASDGANRYVQRYDGGLQAGVGYRRQRFQLQASHTRGLRNLAVQYQGSDGTVYDNSPAYYNRAFQVAFSYLVGSGS